MQPVEKATIRELRKACATSAGTWAFIAQVSGGLPSAPNLRPAMKMMLEAWGRRRSAASSSRSHWIVSMPRRLSQFSTPSSLKRATPMIRRSGRAAFASPASVGPILPPTPRTMISPSTRARSSTKAWLGRHNSSSRASTSGIVSGRVSRDNSMFRPSFFLLHPDVVHHERPFEAEHQAVKRDAEQRQQHDRHHHRGRIERGLHLNHEIAKPTVGGDELADDRAGDREDRADLHP